MKTTNHDVVQTETLEKTLAVDRFIVLVALFLAVVGSGLFVYQSISTGSLEVVYLDHDRIDSPKLLPKVRNEADSLKGDKWVRAFAMRFINFYFTLPDDSTDFARRSLAWVHAHSTARGKVRSEALVRDFETYDNARQERYQVFYADEHDSLKIRQSSTDRDTFYVAWPGVYETASRDGHAYFKAVLNLTVKRADVTGMDSGLGAINVFGLAVDDAHVEFIEDATRPNEVTKVPLFHFND